ncbi:TPA: hypothetical protein SFZ51_001592 [Campylobacter jejuni]|uniref:Uncharacterized protein n=1 Tax=Campylobacter jejuni TaxID=197 RepID=A0A431EA87_CAMJU|nr:hypothetical protein [Campylobacter jejuni]RTJ77997.1 hypothetical protein C3H57_09710 [Campylobacter jejuni]HEG8091976.1 hypothetical protein [Campylobacter jejuni]HEG8098417.1 hypothetical protein [Campylobacter jejuni]HEG8104704.1 hypothetical protein [Campylobacter jejuni]HEG8133562.1 hypothetical protein [Campylobacter jejuni]
MAMDMDLPFTLNKHRYDLWVNNTTREVVMELNPLAGTIPSSKNGYTYVGTLMSKKNGFITMKNTPSKKGKLRVQITPGV